MKKTVIWLVFVLHLIILTGCTQVKSEDRSVLDGTTLHTYSTQWFDFTVISVKTAQQINQYLPYTEGYQFLIVTILEKNTYKNAITMSCWDFCLEEPSLKEEDRWARNDFQGHSLIMPTEFTIEPGGSVAYDLIFCIPSDLTSMGISYTEIDERNQEGATFQVLFDIPSEPNGTAQYVKARKASRNGEV